MALHKNLTSSDIHIAHALTYADAAARTGATGLTADDVGKIAVQSDNKSFWILQNHSPVTWGALTSAESDTLLELFLDSDPTTPTNDYSITRVGNQVTQEKWIRHADSSNLKTIDYTYSGGKVSTEVVKVFAANGSTVLAQKTGTYSYSGNQVTGIAWVRNV